MLTDEVGRKSRRVVDTMRKLCNLVFAGLVLSGSAAQAQSRAGDAAGLERRLGDAGQHRVRPRHRAAANRPRRGRRRP